MLKGIEYFKPIAELPSDRIDQNRGIYHPSIPCCVGAHLANQLNVSFGNSQDYIRGVDAWAKKMGVTRAHIILMLSACGGGLNPLSTGIWELPPAEVYQNLIAIEQFPTLIGADLSSADLSWANLAGHDLTGADLNEAYLIYANLTGTNLTKADLRWATLRKTKLTDANLTDANLQFADITDVDFTNANTTRTIFNAKTTSPIFT